MMLRLKRMVHVKNTEQELAGKPMQGAGLPIGSGQREAREYAEERTGDAPHNAAQAAEYIATMRAAARRSDRDGEQIKRERPIGAHTYEALEGDFRAHHQTNAARRHGPYEHYRLVYRYGYDLGSDMRYRSAEWSRVEQEARPRWEERNPDTWERFKDTIRYAWDKTRRQG